MQPSGPYFMPCDDEHSSLLGGFHLSLPMPLSIEEEAAASTAGQYNFCSSFPDPLQNPQLHAACIPEIERPVRNDQMKLTFIMDSAGAKSPSRTLGSAVTATSSFGSFTNDVSANSDETLVQDGPEPCTQMTSSSIITPTIIPSPVTKRVQKCTACDMVFTMKSKALYHLYMEHPEVAPSRVFPCTSCENAFLRKSDMTKHYDCVHLRLRPSKCSLCPSAFFFRKDLLKHQRTVHEKRRDFVFGKKEHMKRHMIALHSGNRETI